MLSIGTLQCLTDHEKFLKELSLERPKVEKTAFAFIIQDNSIVDSDNDLEEPFLSEYSTYNSHQMDGGN